MPTARTRTRLPDACWRAAANADLLHLRALAAETMGDHTGARALYRAALERSAESLTPMTRALVMTNLAVSMNHVDPEESLSLTRLAGTLLAAEELDPRLRPTLANVEGYALICLTRLDEARTALRCAAEEGPHDRSSPGRAVRAVQLGDPRRAEGAPLRAGETLELVRRACAAEGLDDLEGWSAVRLSWLRVRGGDALGARSLLHDAGPLLTSMRFSESLRILNGLIGFEEGRLAGARMDFESVLRSAQQRGDLLTQLAILLWLALLERRAGRDNAAERATGRALALARTHGLCLSPNWWSPEIVRAAREHASDAATAKRLFAPPGDPPRPRVCEQVHIFHDGRVDVGGKPLDPSVWQLGRTGSRVLPRFFARLTAAYPSAVPRDELAEHLWPDSDGDRAIRNLYSATVDLRRCPAELPGVALVSEGGSYALRCAATVEFHGRAAARDRIDADSFR